MRMRSSAGGRDLREFSFEEEAPGRCGRWRGGCSSRRWPPSSRRAPSPSRPSSNRSPGKGPRAHCWSSRTAGGYGRRWLSAATAIARWMGFSEPRFVGHMAFRGLADYAGAGGQPFEPKVNYIYGRGLRAGFVPVSPTKVYWFICFNSPIPGPKNTDAEVLKREVLELVRGWPDDLVAVMRSTPDAAVVKTPLVDRWLWPGVAPPASRSGVVLVGDAWHPMTPNLGQGACCALEDAVVLARRLAPAVLAGGDVGEAMSGYERERWGRVFPLTARAGLVGALVQWGNPVVCAVRDGVVIPRLVRLGPFLEHTNFECGLLEPVAPSP
uniref:Uncharacterized protein n=1 Tax=Avena sativa TaxID=4498 RepID=A0ACD5UN54_AVESA